MQLDVRTILVLFHPTDPNQILLLKRSSTKKLFPGLITGIGGKVEIQKGEDEDLEAALWREFTEETKIDPSTVIDTRLRLTTIVNRDNQIVILTWFTGKLSTLPSDLTCTEGELLFFDKTSLASEPMIPTAREAIPFITSLADSDTTRYSGSFSSDGTRLSISA